jgi:hypothetical protein
MNKSLFVILGILCAGRLLAQEAAEADLKVIHQYSYVNLSLGCIPARDDVFVGVRFDGSLEYNGFLLWLKAGEFGNTFDDMSRVSGGVGYAIRLDHNRINIVPRLGVSHQETTESDLSDNSTTDKSTGFEPSITFSYAFNNHFSLDAGYALDVGNASVSQLNLGATLAFAKRWGVRLEGTIATDQNYDGFFAGVAYHF